MGEIPATLQIHTLIAVAPLVDVDDYGNETFDYGPGATRTTIRGRVQQDQRAEPYPDGRHPQEQRWTLFTGETLAGIGRIEWPTLGLVFDVYGPPEPTYDGAGYHHTEATLRAFVG